MVKFREAIELTASVARRMLVGANLASLSLMGTPRHMLDYVNDCLFLHKIYTGRRGIPERHVYTLWPAAEVASITLAIDPKWPHRIESDLVCLCLICRLLQPKLVFEIGTSRGLSAFHFALNTSPDCKIYTLDLPKDRSILPRHQTYGDRLITEVYLQGQHPDLHVSRKGYVFENTDVGSKINLLFGDSTTFNYSDFYGKIDFFFIDGSHSYEYVRSDTLNALKCCHSGSIIAWHDFGLTGVGVHGVTKCVVELSKQYEIYCEPHSRTAFMKVP